MGIKQWLKHGTPCSQPKRVQKAALCADLTAYSTKESSNQENGGFLAHKNTLSKIEIAPCCMIPTQSWCQELSSDLLRFSKHQGEYSRQAEFVNPGEFTAAEERKKKRRYFRQCPGGLSFKKGYMALLG